MKLILKTFLLIVISSVMIISCNTGEDFAIETNDWGNLTITLIEPGLVTNIWVFDSTGSTGIATLQGTGDFTYTYEKTDVNSSTLTFDVQGEDKYELTWMSANSGTFSEYFNGVAGSMGTFTLIK